MRNSLYSLSMYTRLAIGLFGVVYKISQFPSVEKIKSVSGSLWNTSLLFEPSLLQSYSLSVILFLPRNPTFQILTWVGQKDVVSLSINSASRVVYLG